MPSNPDSIVQLNNYLSWLLFLVALSACAMDERPAANQASRIVEPSLGQVVSELDPRIWIVHQSLNDDYWFGSNGKGVFRYDGEQLTQYTEADGLVGQQVRAIEEDSKGNVFFSTNSGLSKFDGQQFTTVELESTSPSEDGWKLNRDDVWLAQYAGQNGPYRYDGEKLYRLKLSKSPQEDAYRAAHTNLSFSPYDIYGLYKDRSGHMWFGTASVGLCRYDGEGLTWMYEEALTTTPSGGAFGVRSIFEDSAGAFWICNTRQRFQISAEAKLEDGYSLIKYERSEGLPGALSDTDRNFTYYQSMVEDPTGALWMAGGTDGVLKYDGDVVTRYAMKGGVHALSVCCDQEGKLWVGTLEDGVHVFNGTRFERFQIAGLKR